MARIAGFEEFIAVRRELPGCPVKLDLRQRPQGYRPRTQVVVRIRPRIFHARVRSRPQDRQEHEPHRRAEEDEADREAQHAQASKFLSSLARRSSSAGVAVTVTGLTGSATRTTRRLHARMSRASPPAAAAMPIQGP